MTGTTFHDTVALLRALPLSSDSKIYTANDGQLYQDALRRWSKRAIKSALAVIIPATVSDVAKTVLFAKNNDIPLAVKCGGHSPGGASSVDNGLVIDLSLFRQVTVQPEEQLVTAGGGCLYADINEAAGLHGLACVGGSTSHVGIGGLMLHGGYGYLTGQYGLAVDNILGIEAVTSDGEIIWADEKSNTDLFWAMRGAGSHFGIVTKFIIKAHKVNRVWGGVMVFSRNQTDAVVDAVHAWYAKKDAKASAALAFGKGSDGKACLTMLPFYDGEKGETSFAPFLALDPVVNDTSIMSYSKINTLANEPGLFTDDAICFASGNIKPTNMTTDFVNSTLDRLDLLYESVPTSEKTGALVLLVQPDAIMRVAPAATAFPWRDDHFDVGIAARWRDQTQEIPMMDFISHFQAWIVSHGNPERLYSNHSDFTQPAMEFGNNHTTLLDQKSKWDASNVFRSF